MSYTVTLCAHAGRPKLFGQLSKGVLSWGLPERYERAEQDDHARQHLQRSEMA